jgi:hypothetical protein
MALADPIISHTVDSGQTAVTVYFHTPGGNEGHVNMSREMRDDPLFWPMLRLAAARVDIKAAVLRQANRAQLEE